jgi:hypothetical protein
MARKTYRKNGGGTQSPADFFNANYHQPSSTAAAITSAPTPGWVRPPLTATNVISPDALTKQSGGRNRRRTMRGGFSPALMGSFVANAHTAIVPLALYGLYYMFGKKGSVPNNTRRNNTRRNNA